MEILILGLTRGSVYALVAVGFVLAFSVGGILNLAHGTLFMLGAYFTYIYFNYLFAAAGTLALVSAIMLAIISVIVVAMFLFFVLFRRKMESLSFVMVISLAFALFVEQLTKVFFGVTSTSVPPLIRGSIDIFGVIIPYKELILLPVSLTALLGLEWFLTRTKLGAAIRAVAQCRDGAVLVGIRPDRVLAISIAISAALAALAGTLVSSLVTVTPTIWSYWLVKAFTIAIVGGLGSIPGAVIAAFLLSFIEIATTFALTDQYGELIALVIIAIILVFRPSGLMASRQP